MARQPKPWFRKDRQAWFVTVHGQRHNLGPDKKAAFERFYTLMRQPAAKKISIDSFVAIADAFLEWTQQHRSPDTYDWYRYRIERFCQRYPDLITSEMKPYHVQQWVDSYPNLAQTTRRNYVRSIKRCLTWARQQGYIDENPIRDIEVPGAERRELFVTPTEFNELLNFIPDEAFADLCIVAYETGCRPQEVLKVEASHVDLANERWVFKVNESKGKKTPRVVYLTPKSMEVTKRFMLKHPTGKLFRNSRGQAWTKNSVNCAFCRVQQRMGKAAMTPDDIELSAREIDTFTKTLKPTRSVKGETVKKSPAELRQEARSKLLNKRYASKATKLCLYVFRHSFATRALQAGVDSLTVALLLGHADVSQTARVYQHLSHNPEHLRSQVRRAAG